MRRITADAVTFNACEGCAAVYITPNRLNQLLLLNTQAQERVLRQVDRASPDRMRRRNTMLNCPECRIVMFLSPMGVISKEPVHTCTRCFGLFLAPGKLGMILSGRR
jgi:Zn-finger nucleic acid-binding protein